MTDYNEEVFESTEDQQSTEQTTDEPTEQSTEPTQEEPEQETEQPTEQDAEQETEQDTEVPEDVDNPKSYKHFQSLAEKRLVEYEREKARREEMERQLNEFKQPSEPNEKKEEPEAIEPPTEPQKPSNYDAYEAATDPDSPSYKYEQAYKQYLADHNKFLAKKYQQIEQERQSERQKQKQLEEQKQQQQYYITELQKVGVDEQKAQRMLKFFSNPESLKPEYLAKMYDAVVETKTSKKPKPKSQSAAPLATAGGEHAPTKTPDDDFNSQLGENSKYVL